MSDRPFAEIIHAIPGGVAIDVDHPLGPIRWELHDDRVDELCTAIVRARRAHVEVGPIDIATLDPGIRETVRRLRDAGFDTRDSGDGVTKLAAGWEALDFPHVVIRCEPAQVVAEARRLHTFVTEHGICVEPVGHSSVWIEASYDPVNDIATIMLAGMSDAAWATP